METMIVEIFIPAISGSFDFQVPSAGLVGEMISEIVEILEQTQPGLTFDRDYPMLCHLSDRRILQPDDTLAAAGVYDGVKLMLI